ncbi:hypothetical protein A6M21_17105 [Desulfotomaculum copahuensis]|uniref:Polyhydroxyalkanoate synthesis regulator n=2 Tax=Desulfotomaculum copahuensis TaxID=1838280 RepID=A0A1B7LHE2_9FIRM|nr:hypothetical protein A6M21_17105 [Desulfotomaculum copahuensis]
MLAGIGAAALTREKAELVVKELSDRGQASNDETKNMVRDLINKGEQERNTLVAAIRREIFNLRDELGLATRQDLAGLSARLDRLEERLAQKQDRTE